MTTNVSPGDTWKLTSRTATTLPTASLISSRPAPASAISRASAARLPKTFHTPSTLTREASLLASIAVSIILINFHRRLSGVRHPAGSAG